MTEFAPVLQVDDPDATMTESGDVALEQALKLMAEEKKRSTAQSSVKTMLKMLQKLQANPRDKKNNKLQITKVFVTQSR